MKMTSFEKRFVNREAKGLANFRRLQGQLALVETRGIARALELGCGIGTVSSMLAREYGWDVCGTDVDPEQIALATEHYGATDRVEYRVEDATALSFPAAHFDLVISQNVFHHIPAWRAACAEIARVLRPGGYLLWHDLAFAAALRPLLSVVSGAVGVYSLDMVATEFVSNGFRVESLAARSGMFFPSQSLVLRRGLGGDKSVG